jgi:NADPH:quinone reductase-like Zn-dependent oxidoreductase
MFGVSDLVGGPHRNLLRTVWHLVRFPRFAPINLMNRNRTVAGVYLGNLWSEDAMMRPQLQALMAYANTGRIRPRVDRSFRFSEAAAAHRYIHERRNIGKVVLVP